MKKRAFLCFSGVSLWKKLLAPFYTCERKLYYMFKNKHFSLQRWVVAKFDSVAGFYLNTPCEIPKLRIVAGDIKVVKSHLPELSFSICTLCSANSFPLPLPSSYKARILWASERDLCSGTYEIYSLSQIVEWAAPQSTLSLRTCTDSIPRITSLRSRPQLCWVAYTIR